MKEECFKGVIAPESGAEALRPVCSWDAGGPVRRSESQRRDLVHELIIKISSSWFKGTKSLHDKWNESATGCCCGSAVFCSFCVLRVENNMQRAARAIESGRSAGVSDLEINDDIGVEAEIFKSATVFASGLR